MNDIDTKEEFTYTAEDFDSSTAPYEHIYKIDNQFLQEQTLNRLCRYAQTIGVKNFRSLYKKYLKNVSNKFDTYRMNQTQFSNQPIELNVGEWVCTDYGVTGRDRFGEILACSHPIMPVERLVNIDTGIEKIKLAFRKNGEWRTIIVEKEMIASMTNIVKLSNMGVMVNSDNARHLIKYLHDCENLNYDLLPEKKCVSRLGWIDGSGFAPYVENLIFDGDANYKSYFDSVSVKGSFEKWLDLAHDIRANGTLASRIILAGSFASVLIKPIRVLPFFIHLWGGTETGKAQPLNTKIITPTGYKLMGDIKIGDDVIGGDGNSHKVIGVYPQGKKDVYELTFKDGTKTRCCKEHLWNIKTLTRKNHNRDFKVISLDEMMRLALTNKKGSYNLRIPITQAVDYKNNKTLPIDAYLLGALLGDGCLTLSNKYLYFNNSEDDVIANVNEKLLKHGAKLTKYNKKVNQLTLTGDTTWLKKSIIDLGLNVLGEYKFIPHEYLTANIESRKDLLKGLMDTDGSITSCGGFTYSTASEYLAKDIVTLCQSLGYRATICKGNRKGTIMKSHGKEYIRKNDEYTIQIWTHDEIFTSLKHKQRNLIARSKHNEKKQQKYDDLPIINIELIGNEECQCIMVDSEEHTYLCDDFIVTHNTVSLMLASSVWANPEMGKYIHTFNSTLVGQEKSASFVNSLPFIMDELQIIKNNKDFDKIIYMLSEGVGRTRGNKIGGVERTSTWANLILTSGESPLTNTKSGAGAVNRIIEIECKEKLFARPKHVADTLKENFGHSGKIFIDNLQKDGAVQMAKKAYEVNYEALSKSDKTEKQAMAMALVLTADMLATHYIFKDCKCLNLDEAQEYMQTKEAVNMSLRAYDFIKDWIGQNGFKFVYEGNPYKENSEIYGVISQSNDIVYIISSVFNQVLEDNGFNPVALKSWLLQNNLVDVGDNRSTVVKRINGINTRCVALHIKT